MKLIETFIVGILINMMVFGPISSTAAHASNEVIREIPLEVRELPPVSPEFSGSLGFDFSTADSVSTLDDNDEPIFGGFIQNRKTASKIALKCVRDETKKCIGYQFYLIPKSATKPSDYINLNPNVVFSQDDVKKINDMAGKKIKSRINPRGFTPPIFGLTFVVWMIAQQNRDHGKKAPVEIAYILTIPVDLALMIPIIVGTAAVWGTKQIIIGIEQKNMNKAIAALEQQGKIRKISQKNFELLSTLIQQYQPAM